MTGIHPDPGRSWLRRALPLVRPHAGRLAAALSAALGSMLLSFQFPRVLNEAVNEVLVAHRNALTPYVRDGVLLAFGTAALSLVARQQLLRLAYELETDLRSLVYEHVTGLGPALIDRYQSGQLISRASSDVRTLQLYLAFGPFVVVQCAGALVALGFMLTIDVPLALVSVALLPLVGMCTVGMQRALFPASWLVQERLAGVATVVDESIAGVVVVKAYSAEERQLTALARASHRLRWAYVVDADLRARWAPVAQNLSQLSVVAVLLLGGHRVLEGQLEVGAILAFATYSYLLQAPFQMVGTLVMLGQRAAASAGRVYELLDERPLVDDADSAQPLVITDAAVLFEDVSFAYDPRQAVLRGCTFGLRRGETVALVGRTGSGKSTIARLLTRDYDVDSGCISVDGQDIRTVTRASLRAAVSVAMEEPFLFSGRVRDNIAYGIPDASLDQVETAARAACAHEFVAALPEGYDTVVGERGHTLSGGQRQRIALARAALSTAPVLVLDDATSALDVEVEEAVHRALTSTLAGRTTLVVAHRLSTIRAADRVLVLDAGRIVADGTHVELLASSEAYRKVLAHAHAHEETPPSQAPVEEPQFADVLGGTL
jgi:ATP-binding cassette subfamily B protein